MGSAEVHSPFMQIAERTQIIQRSARLPGQDVLEVLLRHASGKDAVSKEDRVVEEVT